MTAAPTMLSDAFASFIAKALKGETKNKISNGTLYSWRNRLNQGTLSDHRMGEILSENGYKKVDTPKGEQWLEADAKTPVEVMNDQIKNADSAVVLMGKAGFIFADKKEFDQVVKTSKTALDFQGEHDKETNFVYVEYPDGEIQLLIRK